MLAMRPRLLLAGCARSSVRACRSFRRGFCDAPKQPPTAAA
eukprot:COSAG06_NODE_46900_length_343_cov_0.963115_1_plen_40_part_10